MMIDMGKIIKEVTKDLGDAIVQMMFEQEMIITDLEDRVRYLEYKNMSYEDWNARNGGTGR